MNKKTFISRNTRVMTKLKNSIPNKAQTNLYNRLIQSHLYYCVFLGTKSLNLIQSSFSGKEKAIDAADLEYHNYFCDKETSFTLSFNRRND